MSLWLLIIGALILQEGVSTSVILYEALHNHYSLLIINAIWLASTVAQILLGYLLGRWIKRRFANSKADRWLEKNARKVEKVLGERGEEVGLVFMSYIISPAATALLAPWLDISFIRVFIFAFLGDSLWYALTWAKVFGATEIITYLKYGLVIVIVLVVAGIAYGQFKRLRRLHS